MMPTRMVHRTRKTRRRTRMLLKIVTRSEPVTLLLVSLVVIAACSGQNTKDPRDLRKLTVCDLLKNVEIYRGKTVVVRGIYWLGLRQACPEPFVVGGRT